MADSLTMMPSGGPPGLPWLFILACAMGMIAKVDSFSMSGDAMTGHVLDLTRQHFHRQLGDIAVIGTWLGASVDESEPCLVLVPSRRTLSYERTRPCCIALSSAYLYDDPSYLLQRSRQFNEALGFTDNMANVHKVATVIYDHLQDLIEMPPRPVERTFVGAEATITDSSGRKRTAEILDYE